ncbi:MAG: AAA family ATPase [Proteobacteria bacterium]|nr:AAA family ATPase [Pseudomonadota bacterium]
MDTTCKIYQTLHQLDSFTLHRLLSYNPRKNQFNYDAENRFPEKTLFIIDEASMIDIDLFAKLLQALPEKNFRLFILGDPDQLPSFEAEAVLGEMLKTGDVTVKLDESKRFNRDSKIGRLSLSIQEENAVGNGWPDKYEKPVFEPLSNLSFSLQDDNILRFISLREDKKEEEKDVEKLIKAWTDAFYITPKYLEQVSKIQVNLNNELIDVDTQQPCDTKKLDELWQFTESARILSAERKGTRGIQSLNACVRKALGVQSNDSFYVGQFLMITENQSTLKLYNGDCGIVLGEPNSGRLHLLLKKVHTQNKAESEEIVSDYVTYPLSLLPPDALESAFAITIHKSQGSGYGNIMMFLPQTVGHPLLNNQMIYTGVTRTEKKSLTIVASQAAFEAGCQTSIERDTGIDIGI